MGPIIKMMRWSNAVQPVVIWIDLFIGSLISTLDLLFGSFPIIPAYYVCNNQTEDFLIYYTLFLEKSYCHTDLVSRCLLISILIKSWIVFPYEKVASKKSGSSKSYISKCDKLST